MNTDSKKLEALKDMYRQHLCGGGKIEISLLQGNASQQLSKYIEQYDMDLVVVGLAKFNLIHRILSSVSISVSWRVKQMYLYWRSVPAGW